MSTIELPRYGSREISRSANTAWAGSAIEPLIRIASPLASLRLTVVLLALSVFLVLAGTLAQIDRDVWYVVKEYFRTWVAWIPLQLFLPRSLDWSPNIGFPFPGGKLIGTALAINLVAAHALRFKVVGRGLRLWIGVGMIALGAAITWAVIAGGGAMSGESELSPAFCRGLWHALRALLGAGSLTSLYLLALNRQKAVKSQARWLWRLAVAAAAISLALAIYLYTHPSVRLDPAGLRIMWQLLKAGAASIILGVGCWYVFDKRAGIVLLHSGVGLLMISELLTASQVVESQMQIPEGQTARFAEDHRSFELAVTDLSSPLEDKVTVVPGELLVRAAKSGEVINDPALPFGVRIVEYLPSSRTRLRQPGEKTLATEGSGRFRAVDAAVAGTGVDTEQQFDIPSAYVEFLEKPLENGDPKSAAEKSLGVYLLSAMDNPDEIEVDGVRNQVALRYHRLPKEYSVTLLDFKFDRYIGTDTAKNFESVVRFRDPERNVDRQVSISMNNPLRYQGETFYQQSFDRQTEQTTVLQVVSNSNWMIPYVACVIVGVGMLIHFSQAIVRFLRRREEEFRRQPAAGGADRGAGVGRLRGVEFWAPLGVVTLVAISTLYAAMPRHDKPLQVNIREFGKLPVAYGGRTQPLDSLARLSLRTISGKESYEDSQLKMRQPAIRWLLDVVSRSPAFKDHRVIRIVNTEVAQILGLKPRDGFRYSLSEVLANGQYDAEVTRAAAIPKQHRDLTQQKLLEAAAHVETIATLLEAFGPPTLEGETREGAIKDIQRIKAQIERLNRYAPRPVLPAKADAPWETMLEAETPSTLATVMDLPKKPEANLAADGLLRIFAAYRDGQPAEFNRRVAEYQKLVGERADAEMKFESELAAKGERSERKPAERLELNRIAFEAWYNQFDPLFLCWILYLAAFVLTTLGWFGWFRTLNRTANWLLWFTFALHTFGLICRVYISGRPPITNIYSVSVFIGWAAVLFSLVFESIYRMGLGNLMAAAMGFPTLVIAHYLSIDGDTLGVMQAVLDTNFWLATHVVCINLGCATTLLAGGLGVVTLVGGEVLGKLSAEMRRSLSRMTYGTLCFAIFFSFVGTILGGLWGDDSWGRFWGWDPKENGALMIVLWNALTLHARWGKMCGERGLAALCVMGNIVTVWCLFGVNQMGVGLHAYGFIEGRTFWIALFMISQLAVIAAAYAAPLVRNRKSAPLTTSV